MPYLNYWSTYAPGSAISITRCSAIIEASTVHDNTVNTQGAINLREAALAMSNSTVSSNHGTSAGGISMSTYATLSLRRSTVAGNSASNGYGAGLRGSSLESSATIAESVIAIAESVIGAQASGTSCSFPSSTSQTSGGFNVDRDGSCGLIHSTDRANIDPLLAPLSDNGGGTLTHAPMAGSPLLDRGGACTGADQRGVARPQDSNGDGRAECDVGAVEWSATEAETITAVARAGQTVTTDEAADGASATDPVETSVKTPVVGSVTIAENDNSGTGPSDGFDLLGQIVDIDAPIGTVTAPLVIVLRVDASLVPAGETKDTIGIFRNGTLVGACTGAAGQAVPDPCVSLRERLADGDLRFTVLTTQASDWSLGIAVPVADAGGPYDVPEGGSVALDASGSVGSDGQSASITGYAWDLDGDAVFGETGADAARGDETGAAPTFSAAGLVAGDAAIVMLRVTDDEGLTDDAEAVIGATSVPPQITAVTNDGPVAPGDPATITVAATDPVGDPTFLLYEFDCDGDDDYEVGPQADNTATCSFGASGTYPVGVRVSDAGGGEATGATSVVVNGPPTVGAVTTPVEPVLITTAVVASATFSDPSDTGQHMAHWSWGDGSTTTQPNVTSPVSASHTYAEPGVYTVSLTITDAFGASHGGTSQYVVVYDPDGGFVTGGGWINSPAGAMPANPTLTGKATFGFVAKYKPGKTLPEGNTEFQFKAGNLNFKSTGDYMWLVVSGSGHKATYKGTGKINGAGNYGVMVTAIDEANTPSTDVDLFRIKIWDKDDGDTVVYDNQLGTSCGAGDDADPCTAIGGGNIKIHKN